MKQDMPGAAAPCELLYNSVFVNPLAELTLQAIFLHFVSHRIGPTERNRIEE